MFTNPQSDSSNPPPEEYYVQPEFANQQIPNWGDVDKQPLGTTVPSMPQFNFRYDLGFPGGADFSQGVLDSQAPSSIVAPLPQPPMIAPSQPAPVPQVSAPPPLRQRVPLALGNLAPGVAMQVAVQAKNTLVLFRLNQAYDDLIAAPKSPLTPFSKLGLELSIEEEYRGLVEEGIPLFIEEQVDWNTAFSKLGESAFHLFMEEELDKAWRQGVALPPLHPDLQLYVELYPLYEEIEQCLQGLQGVTAENL